MIPKKDKTMGRRRARGDGDPTNIPTPAPIGSEDIQKILDDRGRSYGDFPVQAGVAQELKKILRMAPGWERLSPFQREALEMISTKMSRAVCGIPDQVDTYMDIAGYATLAAGTPSATNKIYFIYQAKHRR